MRSENMKDQTERVGQWAAWECVSGRAEGCGEKGKRRGEDWGEGEKRGREGE